MEKKERSRKKPIYKKWWFIILLIILAFPILVFEVACIIVVPPFLIIQVFFGVIITYFIRKKRKKKREKEKEEKKEAILFQKGYKKIYNNVYINEKNKEINIKGKKYGFSQIIDCELIENSNTINSSYGNINGRLKNNGKLSTRVNTFSTETSYCNELYINITIEDFESPNIKLDVRENGILRVNGKKYKESLKNANNILSILKIIISKNNERYLENGTITKIEHKYVTEESIQEQIKKLSELYNDGVLTEYEYSMKKQELLEKK